MTHRQRDLLQFIRAYMDANGGVAPSFDEMRIGLGVVSKSSIHRLLEALMQQGFILRQTSRTRQITMVPDKVLPMMPDKVRLPIVPLAACPDGILLEECARRGLLCSRSAGGVR